MGGGGGAKSDNAGVFLLLHATLVLTSRVYWLEKFMQKCIPKTLKDLPEFLTEKNGKVFSSFTYGYCKYLSPRSLLKNACKNACYTVIQ